MKALAAVDRRLRELKSPQTSDQLAQYLALSKPTVLRVLRELREMNEVRRFSAGGKWYYEVRRNVPTV